jgi:hypothetical protein
MPEAEKMPPENCRQKTAAQGSNIFCGLSSPAYIAH